MRLVGMTLAALLFTSLAVQAQPPARTAAAPGVQPPASPPAPVTDAKLDAHLNGWEKTMKAVNTFGSDFQLTRTEAVFKKERKYTGSVLVMKPNLARLNLVDSTNKNDSETYICNGKSIFEYNGLQKTITEFKLNPNPGAAGGDNLMLDFLSGMKAANVKQRFQISVLNEDQNYIYLGIKPTLGRDKQEFEQIRFALFGPNVKSPAVPYLPAMVWMLKPNGDTELWVFTGQRTNDPKVVEQDFQFKPVPGWTVKQAPVGPMLQRPGPGGQPMLPGGRNLPAGPGAVKP